MAHHKSSGRLPLAAIVQYSDDAVQCHRITTEASNESSSRASLLADAAEHSVLNFAALTRKNFTETSSGFGIGRERSTGWLVQGEPPWFPLRARSLHSCTRPARPRSAKSGSWARAAAQATGQAGTATPVPQIVGRTPLGVTVIKMDAVVIGWSVKRDLMGKTVVNDKKECIAKIDDLIISPSAESKLPHASFAIVGVGGFLGIGRKDVAIPSEQFKVQDGDIVLTGATKEALKGLPEFKYRKR